MNNLVTFHLCIISPAEGSTLRAIGATNSPSFTSGKQNSQISPSTQEEQELKPDNEWKGWKAPAWRSGGSRTRDLSTLWVEASTKCLPLKTSKNYIFVLFCRDCRSQEISHITCLPYKPIHLQATDSRQSESKLLQLKQASKQTLHWSEKGGTRELTSVHSMERNVHQLGITSTEREDWNHVTTVLKKGKGKRGRETREREHDSDPIHL